MHVLVAWFSEKLRAQHLSRTLDADRRFYNRLAERETNVCKDFVVSIVVGAVMLIIRLW